MAFTGYRVYRGSGGLGTVDFDTPVDTVVSGNDTISIVGAGHTAGVTYTYVVRPVVSDLETPDYSAVVQVPIASNGEWSGNRPVAVSSFSAEPIADNKIRLQWQYNTPRGGTAPIIFAIFWDNNPVVDTSSSADASEAYTTDKLYTKDLTLTDGLTYWFAILAVTATVGGPTVFSEAVIADGTAPAAPTIFSGTVS